MEHLSKLSIIIPTFYPGKIIKKCFASLPKNSEIIIVDNGNDTELEKIIEVSNLKIKHFKIGDVGLSKSFNFGVSKSKNEHILITQPDVYFEKESIKNLINVLNTYPKTGIVAPLLFEKGKYSKYDFLDLNLDKFGKLLNKKRKNRFYKVPSGNFCVEAINATAMLFKKSFIKKIKGWDENIYTYHEDIDLCVKVRKKKYQIIKSSNSIAHHIGFGSHKKKNKEKAEKSRNWHYCWSSLYFKDKYSSKLNFIIFYFKKLIKYFLKTFLNLFLFKKKKFILNSMRLRACLNYVFIKKASYRIDF
jgi:N-acetylglucosaminyl-diphospho-decaprenol L-rhamnosyltransferase